MARAETAAAKAAGTMTAVAGTVKAAAMARMSGTTLARAVGAGMGVGVGMGVEAGMGKRCSSTPKQSIVVLLSYTHSNRLDKVFCPLNYTPRHI